MNPRLRVRDNPLRVRRSGTYTPQLRVSTPPTLSLKDRNRQEAIRLSQQANQLPKGDPRREKLAIRIAGALQGGNTINAQRDIITPKDRPSQIFTSALNIGNFNPVRAAGETGQILDKATEQTPFKGIGDYIGRNTKGIANFGKTQGTVADTRYMTNPVAKGTGYLTNMVGQTANHLNPYTSALAFAGTASMTANRNYDELIKQGKSHNEALLRATGSGLAQAYIERLSSRLTARLGIDKLLSRNLATRIALSGATEAGEEGIQQIVDNLATNKPWSENVASAVGQGALGGVLLGAGFEAAGRLGVDRSGTLDSQSQEAVDKGKQKFDNRIRLNQAGFIRIGDMRRRLQPDELNTLNDFIDYANGNYKPQGKERAEFLADVKSVASRNGIPFTADVQKFADFIVDNMQVLDPEGGFVSFREKQPESNRRSSQEQASQEQEQNKQQASTNVPVSSDSSQSLRLNQQTGQPIKVTPSQPPNINNNSISVNQLAHQMPDGSVMQGPEHEGAVPGSTVRIDKESQPQQQIRVREDQSTARNQNQPVSLRRQQQSSQKLLPEQPPLNLLSTGSIRLSPSQAKQRFKALQRRGSIYEVENELATGNKPFYVSPGGTVRVGNDGTIPVHQRGGEKNISVDRNPVYFEPTPEYLSDVSGFEAYMKDFYRIMEKVFTPGSSQFKKLEEEVIKPFDQVAKGEYVDLQQNVLDDLQKQVVDGLGIKKGSAESVATQMFGEGDITFDQLVQQFGEGRANDIVAADKFFRSRYDELLTRINDGRRKIYGNNPDKLIPRRSDYYRHFREIQDGFQGLKNIFSQQADIPPELAGTSEFTKPKSRFLSLAQRRMGAESDVDAVAGYLNYVPAAAYAIHIDPQIDRLRTFKQNVVASLTDKREEVQAVRDEMSRAIANQEWEAYDVAKDRLDSITENGKFDDTAVNTFLEFLDDYTNDLAGKTNPADRFPQKVLGRKTFRVIDWMNKRVKANVILGNASSSIAQFFNIPQGIAQAGPKYAYKGAVETFKSITQPNEAMEQSTFIKERYFDAYKNFDTSLFEKSRDFAAWMVQVGDEIGTKYIWNSMYQKALSENVKDPVRYADVETRKLVAGRGVGEVPLAQKSRVFQMVAPFQLEVQNLWYVLGDQTSKKQFGKLMTFAIASFLMNEAARSIRGSDVSFNPIEAILDAFDAFEDEEDKAVGAARAGGRIAGEFLSNVPFGQQLASVYPEFGVSLGDETVTREELFGDADPTRFGTGFGGGTLVGRGIQEPLFRLLPPFGGQQIKRTIEGVNTSSKGYSETKGDRIRYVTDDNPIRIAQRAVFGQYSTPNARRYFDEVQTPLGESDSEQLRALPRDKRQGFYDDVISRREVSRESREQGETLTQNRNELAKRIGGEHKDYLQAYGLDETSRDPATIAKMAIKGTGYGGLPDEVLNQYLKENNLKREDIEYALDSDKNTDEKLADFKQQNFQSRDEMLAYLQAGRIKSIDGNYRANERLLRDLYDQGVIDNNELYGLLSIEDGQYKPSSGGSSGSSGGSSRSGGRIKIKKPSKTTASAEDGLKILNSISSPSAGTPVSQSDLDRIIKIARTA